MSELSQVSAELIIFAVVVWLLDRVTSYYRMFPMIILAFVGGEVDLLQELLLMILESSDHLLLSASRRVVQVLGLNLVYRCRVVP